MKDINSRSSLVTKFVVCIVVLTLMTGVGATTTSCSRQEGKRSETTTQVAEATTQPGEGTDNVTGEQTTSADPTEDSSAAMIAQIKDQLGIPADLDTEDKVDFDNPSYWEAGDMWLINCEFYYDGKLVAAALVNQETGELARNIMKYTEE